MLGKVPKSVRWLAGIAALIVLVIAFLVAKADCQFREYYFPKDHDCAGYQIALSIGAWLDLHNWVITALATIAIAWFTLSLRDSTHDLWDVTRRGIQSSEQTQRARLVFQVNEPGLTGFDPVQPSHGGRLEWCFLNVGSTAAVLNEFLINLMIVGRHENRSGMPQPIDPEHADGMGRRTILPPGTVIGANLPNFHWENMINFALGNARWGEFAENNGDRSNLFVIGYVRYADVFDHRYIRGFCALYDVHTENFVAFGGQDYNYERDDRTPNSV